jgi:hypothetical protein
LVLGWIEYHEQWASSMTLRWSSKSFGTTRWSWTIELHQHLVGSIELLPTLVFGGDDSFQCLFFGRQWRLLWWLEWKLCCSTCHVEQLGDPVLQDHNRKSETGLRDDCIVVCGLRSLQLHWPFLDDNGLPTHNPWSVLAIFAASCSNQVGWKDTSDSCDQCRYVLDYPTNSASRLSMYEWQPTTLDCGWGSALHVIEAVVKHKQLHDHLASTLL